MNELKIKEAERTLRLAAEMSDYYYHKPLIICYSGGKDSDVLLDIAKKCLRPEQFEVLNSHTTVDAPETVYHIRKVFKELEETGIKTKIKMPRYKGKPTSMWKLIEIKRMPPTRLARYCCKVLKEASTPNRMAAVGIREDESINRRGRDAFTIREKRKADAEYRSTGHTYAMFKLDQYGGEDAYECEMIKACKKNKDTICNPIYKFTEDDIWEYIRENGIQTNPLYSKGYKRIGCIGCPLGGQKRQRKELEDYPKYKENYIKAFERMQKKNDSDGIKNKLGIQTGDEWFRWWIGEDVKQVRIDDIIDKNI